MLCDWCTLSQSDTPSLKRVFHLHLFPAEDHFEKCRGEGGGGVRAVSFDGLGRPPAAVPRHGLNRRHPETAAMKRDGLGGGDGDGIAPAAGHKEQDAAATGYVCLSALQDLKSIGVWVGAVIAYVCTFCFI